jgi:AraC-like DNA-binding protein
MSPAQSSLLRIAPGIGRDRFVSGDADAVRRHILDMTRGHCLFSVDDASKFEAFRDTLAFLGSTRLQCLRWYGQSGFETLISRPPDYQAILHIPLAGGFDAESGSTRVSVRPGQMLLVSTTGSIRRQWQGDCELLNIALEREQLERALARDLGVALEAPLAFQPLALTDLDAAASLVSLIDTAWRDLTSEHPLFNQPPLGQQAERLLHGLLLKTLPHNYSDRMDQAGSDSGPLYVRRVEAYIRRHAHEPVTLDDLVAVSGASSRSLHYGFRLYRGTTPMKHLKRVRLALARESLAREALARVSSDEEPRPLGGAVTRIALDCGYRSLSQFSRDYKACFGESPLETLQGPRGR